MPKKKRKTKNKKKGKSVTKKIALYPSKILSPVSKFLTRRVKELEKRKRELAKEDPFKREDRVDDNASIDTDAEEQLGHARTSALKEQLDRKLIQTKKALARIRLGQYGICEDCGKMIDTDRLMVYPEATICAKCMKKREK